jgi:outer membrane protein assembly factor BamB
MQASRNRGRFALLTALTLAATAAGWAAAWAADWPQWRGPGRDGAAPGFSAPAAWPTALGRVWSVDVGAGYASPVAAGGKVFVHSRQEDQEVVSAYDLKTGKQLWRDAYKTAFEPKREAVQHGRGPFSTPTVADGSLFTFGINGVLSAYEAASGKLLWRKDFAAEPAPAIPGAGPYYGTSQSPLVDGGQVLVHTGKPERGTFLALDAKTGAVRWSREADGPSYASPVVATFGGVRQLVTLTQKNLVGVALADGKLLWQTPFPVPYDQTILTPVISGDRVILSGEDVEAQAIRVTVQEGVFKTEKVWGTRAVAMYMSSPVLADGLLYGFSSLRKGHLFCLDAATGAVRWQAPGNAGENATLIVAGDALLVLEDDGELLVAARNGDGFRQLARYTVADSATWAHPALVDGGLLVKDAKKLTLWSFAGPPAKAPKAG